MNSDTISSIISIELRSFCKRCSKLYCYNNSQYSYDYSHVCPTCQPHMEKLTDEILNNTKFKLHDTIIFYIKHFLEKKPKNKLTKWLLTQDKSWLNIWNRT